MKTQLLLTQANTLTPLAVHEKIQLKGSDFIYPLGHKNRTVRTDRKSAYSMNALKSLHKMYTKWNGTKINYTPCQTKSNTSLN